MLFRDKLLENLLAHVRQQFFFADPVKYEKVMRQIRTSKSHKAVRAYTVGMYINESDVNICQMCRKPSKHVEAIEIANFGIEMPQLYLSLCPDCARRYKDFREASKEHFKNEMSKAIREIDAETIEDDYEIEISEGISVHFTQTHIAEVKEILNLLDEYGLPGEQSAAEINIVTQDMTPVQIAQSSRIEKVTVDKVIVSRADILVSENRLEKSRNYQRPQQRSYTPSNNVSTLKVNVLGKADDNLPKEGDFVESQKYGQGTIVKVDTKRLEVEFSFYGKKTFIMPTCFEKGLKLVIKPSAKASEQLNVARETINENPLSLAEFFEKSGFEVVDKRENGGALWVVGTRQELDDTVNKAASLFNAYGNYCDGGRAVGYRKAWFTKCKG